MESCYKERGKEGKNERKVSYVSMFNEMQFIQCCRLNDSPDIKHVNMRERIKMVCLGNISMSKIATVPNL